MREPLEMVRASLMQNMVQIRKKNTCFATNLFLKHFGKKSLGAFGVDSPHGGTMGSKAKVLVWAKYRWSTDLWCRHVMGLVMGSTKWQSCACT